MGYHPPNCLHLLLIFVQLTAAKQTRTFGFPGSHCGRRAMSIDGAVLIQSADEHFKSTPCVMKFIADSSHTNQPHFLINFKHIHISDCTTRLSLYYDRTDRGIPNEVFDCKSRSSPILRTPGRHLTLRLDKLTLTGYEYNLVLTSYSSATPCASFHCWNSTECIDTDLQCDNTENCLDGSDEYTCKPPSRALLTAGLGTILAISVAFLVFCIVTIILVTLCCRWRKRHSPSRVVTAVRSTKPCSIATADMPPPYSDCLASHDVPKSLGHFSSHTLPHRHATPNHYQDPRPTSTATRWSHTPTKIPEYV